MIKRGYNNFDLVHVLGNTNELITTFPIDKKLKIVQKVYFLAPVEGLECVRVIKNSRTDWTRK